MKQTDKNSYAYKIGYLFGTILFACVVAALIAITVKFIFWLF
jgi:hypothetical protein